MDSAVIGQFLTAIGSGVLIKTVVDYVKERRKLSSEAKVLEGTEQAQIGLSNVSQLQANQVYLQGIIDTLVRREEQLEEDIEAEKKENDRLRRYAFQLEDQVQALKIQAQQMKYQASVLEQKCATLQQQLSEIGGPGAR